MPTERLVGIRDTFQDNFGRTVAIDGPWLFVASPNEESGIYTHWPRSGNIHVFLRTSQGWQPTQTIRPSSFTAAAFGDQMDAANGVLVVGTPFDRLVVGKAFVYELSNGLWTLTQELITSDPAVNQRFGNAVAVDRGRIVVAEWYDDSLAYASGDANGRVWVFEKDPAGWIETAVIYPVPRQGMQPNYFGTTLALSGDRLAIGALGLAEHVQTFQYTSGTWLHTGWLLRTSLWDPNDPALGWDNRGRFGSALAMEGDWLIVGEPAWADVWPARYGKISTYRSSSVNPGTWDLQQVLQASNASTSASHATDSFGYSLDIKGPKLAVGARFGKASNGSVHGQAYLFELDPAAQLWQETSRFSSRTAETNAVFFSLLGEDVAVSDAVVVAGAEIDLGASGAVQSGAAYVYEQPRGESLCPGVVNSSGAAAELEITGLTLANLNALTARASGLTAPGFGLLLASQLSTSPSTPAGSQGNLCLGGNFLALVHTLGQASLDGFWDAPLDLPQAGINVQPGSTWNFQLWYRDLNLGPISNFTNAISITWQ